MIEWRLSALDDLLAIDRFRQRHRLRPIRRALMHAIEAYFERYSGISPAPGVPYKGTDLPPGIRLTRVYVGRTGGPYRVLFLHDDAAAVFEILRIAHPRENSRRS